MSEKKKKEIVKNIQKISEKHKNTQQKDMRKKHYTIQDYRQ